MRNSVISLRLKNWLMKDWRMANYDLWTTTRMFQVLVRPLLFVFWQFFLILTYIWFLQFLMHVMDTIYKLYTILAQPRTNKTYLDWLKKLLRIGVKTRHTRSIYVCAILNNITQSIFSAISEVDPLTLRWVDNIFACLAKCTDVIAENN